MSIDVTEESVLRNTYVTGKGVLNQIPMDTFKSNTKFFIVFTNRKNMLRKN